MRFAILADSPYELQEWQADVVGKLLADGHELALIISPMESGLPESRIRRVIRRLFSPNSFWWVWGKIDKARKVRAVPVSSPDVLMACTGKREYARYFGHKDVRYIELCDLDFILRFGFGIIRGEILDAARYGVWSFHVGDPAFYRGGPPCLWEIAHGEGIIHAMLQRLGDKLDAGTPLRRGVFPLRDYSIGRAFDSVIGSVVEWPAIVARQIEKGIHVPLALGDVGPIRRLPTNTQMVGVLWRLARNNVRRFWRRYVLYDRWCIGIVGKPIHEIGHGCVWERPDVAEIIEPDGDEEFIADPFLVEIERGNRVILYESMRENGRGCIRSMRLDGSGRCNNYRPEFHVSYPYVITRNGKWFMIPEKSAVRRVEAYENGIQWPGRIHVLLDDFPAVDPTVFEYAGHWWMWATSGDRNTASDLYLFHAPSLFGPWEPHPQNPVKTDCRSARPAGTPYVSQGILYRPAQVYDNDHQRAVMVNEVVEITPYAYREIPSHMIYPPYPYDGLHTVSFGNSITVVDLRKRAFRRWI